MCMYDGKAICTNDIYLEDSRAATRVTIDQDYDGRLKHHLVLQHMYISITQLD